MEKEKNKHHESFRILVTGKEKQSQSSFYSPVLLAFNSVEEGIFANYSKKNARRQNKVKMLFPLFGINKGYVFLTNT